MKNMKLKFQNFKEITLKEKSKKLIIKLNNKIYYTYRWLIIKYIPINVLDFNFRSHCTFLYNKSILEKLSLEQNKISQFENIIISACKVCNHELNFLGCQNEFSGRNLLWNVDFKTGFVWKNKFYKCICLVNLSNNADVKVPWELSRFQHVFTIGKAYWITDDEKYALEFKNQVKDWIIKNPIEMSVNWACTMDVAIRAVNLICGYFFFEKSNRIDYKFWIEFNKSLYLHGRFIYKNLENKVQNNGNHYLSDLVGLIWLGVYFGDFSIKDKEKNNNPQNWLEFGISEFEKEMRNQVNEDGTDYEASTSYHKFVTELFLITTILCNRNNIYFSKEYTQRLEKMCEFIMNISKPNGLSPIIGDADDGRLIISSNYYNWNRRDFRYVLAIAGEYFDRDDFRAIGKDFKEDALWVNGNFKYVNKNIQIKSKAYYDGGYYILRNDKVFCIIRCGQLSCNGDGGHSHNDQLSFELNVQGEDFIIDSGTYVYSADYKMRNLFRSTKMHNTLYIQDYEQNDFNEYNLFYMKEQSFAKCKLFNDNVFIGEHYGFLEKCNVIHERSININNYEIIIEDKLIGNKINEKVYFNFVLDYNVKIEEREKEVTLIKNGKKIIIKFQYGYKIKNAYVSYGYGQKLDTKKLLIEMNSMDSITKIIYK